MVCCAVPALCASLALWGWFLSPLAQVGIAGGHRPGGPGRGEVVTYMAMRYVAALLMLALAETALFVVLRLFLR